MQEWRALVALRVEEDVQDIWQTHQWNTRFQSLLQTLVNPIMGDVIVVGL